MRIKYYYRYKLDGIVNSIFIFIISIIILFILLNIKITNNDVFIKVLLKDTNNYINIDNKPSILDYIRSVELPFYYENNHKVEFNYMEEIDGEEDR